MPDEWSADLLESTIAEALDLRDTARTDEDWDHLWSLLAGLQPFGRVAFDKALALLEVDNDVHHALGCDLLGTLCNPDNEGWSHEAAEALSRVSESDDDLGVVWSIAGAFNHIADPLGVAVLSGYGDHADKYIRLLVAQGIISCRTNEDGEDVQAICEVLLHLMNDEDGEVRDWATFGLGHQLESDGPEIRQALYDRLNDPDGDTHWEAVLGLARRHDARAFDYVHAGLVEESVSNLAVWSAWWLGDERLLPALQDLASWWSNWPLLLEGALSQCDPVERQRRSANEALFLELFGRAVEAGRVPPGFGVAISIPCVGYSEGDVELAVTPIDHNDGIWSLHNLINTASQGDVAVAVDKVIEAMDSRSAQRNHSDGSQPQG